MSVKQSLQAAALRESLRYVRRNPEQNFARLIALIRPFARLPWHREIIQQAGEMWADPQNNWRRFTERALQQLAPNVAEKIVMNFFLNACLSGVATARTVEKEHDCNVPWAILMDPTSSCNLHCEGCWAGE